LLKKRFYILPTNTNLAVTKVIYFVYHCQSCHELNLGQGETFEIKIKKLAVVVHVLWTTQNFVISRCCFVEDGKEMYKEL